MLEVRACTVAGEILPYGHTGKTLTGELGSNADLDL